MNYANPVLNIYDLQLPIQTLSIVTHTHDNIYGLSWCMYMSNNTAFQPPIVTCELNKVMAIILHLVEPLIGEFYTVWLDNFYNCWNTGASTLLGL
jgi:hypothetical protein